MVQTPRLPRTASRRHFTIDEYYRMAVAGIIHEDERTELLGGEIVEMSPIGDRHAICVDILTMWFVPRLIGRAWVRIQSHVHLSPNSEPVPDVVIGRLPANPWAPGYPQPEDVLLLIEVSDTTLRQDRDVKLPFYAAAGIPEVWIVDLNAARVLVYRDPEGTRYRTTIVAGRDDTLSPLAFPDLALPVADLLG